MCDAIPAGWQRTTFGAILKRRLETANGNEELLSVMADHGVIPQGLTGRRNVSSADKSAYLRVYPGDIVYNTMRMWQGVSGCSEYHGIVSPAYTVCSPIDSVDGEFIAKVIRHPLYVAQFRRLAQGLTSDVWNLRYSAFGTIPFLLPPHREQQRIAEILDAAEIEIHHTDRTLTKERITKQAIWENLCACVKAPTFKLGQLLSQDPRNGYSPVETLETTGTFVLGLGCLTSDGFAPSQLKPIPAQDPSIKRALLSDGDLLISRSNTRELVGMAGRYRDIGFPCIYPDLMMRLKLTENVRPEFLELSLRSGPVRRQIQGAAQGTSSSMVKISAATVRDLTIKLPRPNEQDHILRAMRRWDEKQANLKARLDKLRLVRRGLMDDLLSGKVRVGEV